MDGLIIHTNDWGGYSEDVIILEGGAAFCQLSIPGRDEPDHGDRTWLHDLSVIPGRRREGLAKRLLEICKERTRLRHRENLSLWVRPGSWQEQWYRRLGFEHLPEFFREDGKRVYNLKLQ